MDNEIELMKDKESQNMVKDSITLCNGDRCDENNDFSSKKVISENELNGNAEPATEKNVDNLEENMEITHTESISNGKNNTKKSNIIFDDINKSQGCVKDVESSIKTKQDVASSKKANTQAEDVKMDQEINHSDGKTTHGPDENNQDNSECETTDSLEPCKEKYQKMLTENMSEKEKDQDISEAKPQNIDLPIEEQNHNDQLSAEHHVTVCDTMKKAMNTSVSLNEKKVNSRSATPVNVKSRSSTPVSKSTSRSNTPVQKPGSQNTNQAADVTEQIEESPKKKVNKPSKVAQVLKGATAEVTNLRPIAQVLFDIGMDVTRQFVYRDLIKIQKKKETMDKLDEKEKNQLEKLQNAFDELISKNDSFMNEVITCTQCGYKTDTENVLELHKEYAHNQEYNMFTCSFCSESTKVASAFLYHMEAMHNRKGRIFMKHAFFVCPYCPYESNTRNPFQKHMEKCMKGFREKNNLVPLAPDCDIPLKAANKQVVQEKKPAPAQTSTKSATQSMQELQNAHRVHQARAAAQRMANIKSQATVHHRPPGSQPGLRAVISNKIRMPTPTATQHVTTVSPPSQNTNNVSNSTGTLVQMNGQWYRLAMVGTQQFLMPVPPPSVNQMPQNKPIIIQGPSPSVPAEKPPKNSSFEVCEICGGFVKDRESLRVHFFFAHKVDMHKDLFQAPTPPLACIICSKVGKRVKFWTYQGLSRHRGLEHKGDKENDTPAQSALMKEISRKCVVCTQVYANSTTVQQYWNHMEVHGITPSRLFMLKKCLICGISINDSKVLEKHLLGSHSLLFRNISLKGIKDTSPNDPLKKSHKTKTIVCNLCSMPFNTQQLYVQHCNQVHLFKCSRCPEKLSSRDTLMKHFHDIHSNEKDPCFLCNKVVKIGRPMIRHMKCEHIKKCSVVLTALPDSQYKRQPLKRKLNQDNDTTVSAAASPDRSMSKNDHNDVIVIDLDSPQKQHLVKKSPESEPQAKKQILEVDGEEIVVEIQQDESLDEDSENDHHSDASHPCIKENLEIEKESENPKATKECDKVTSKDSVEDENEGMQTTDVNEKDHKDSCGI